MYPRHWEQNRSERTGWLRAVVLGANDGIASTASLALGVAAAQATHSNELLAGFAGLVAGPFRWPQASMCQPLIPTLFPWMKESIHVLLGDWHDTSKKNMKHQHLRVFPAILLP